MFDGLLKPTGNVALEKDIGVTFDVTDFGRIPVCCKAVVLF
jgi:hypothetical protein